MARSCASAWKVMESGDHVPEVRGGDPAHRAIGAPAGGHRRLVQALRLADADIADVEPQPLVPEQHVLRVADHVRGVGLVGVGLPVDAVRRAHRPQPLRGAGGDLGVGGPELGPELVSLLSRGAVVADDGGALQALPLVVRDQQVVARRAAERHQSQLRLAPVDAVVRLRVGEAPGAFLGQAALQQRVVPQAERPVRLAPHRVVGADAQLLPRLVRGEDRLRVLHGRVHGQGDPRARRDEAFVDEELPLAADVDHDAAIIRHPGR